MFSRICIAPLLLALFSPSLCFEKYVRILREKAQEASAKNLSDRSLPEHLHDLSLFLQSYPEVFENIRELNNASQCYDDWQVILSYSPGEVFKFWDSYPVPGTGILEGNRLFPGQSEECYNAKTGLTGLTVRPFPDTENFIVNFNGFNLGMCNPSSCSAEEVSSIFGDGERYILARNKFNADAGFVIAVVVYSLILSAVFCATLRGTYLRAKAKYEKLQEEYRATSDLAPLTVQEEAGDEAPKKQQQPREPLAIRILMCFDFYANFCKILETPKVPNPDQLAVLNGMRVMSLGWVIIAHLLLLWLAAVDNIAYVIGRSKNMLFQTIANGFSSVDTFFVMGACLVMLGALRSLDKLKSSNKPQGFFWFMFYVHRLIRLWPTLLLTILFVAGIYANLAPLFYSPFFQNNDPNTSLAASCKGSNWISTAFFYNNLIANPNIACLGWSWYVSNDIQFYIISPLFVILAKQKRLFGVAAISTTVAISTLIVLLGSGINKVPAADSGVPIIAVFETAAETFDLTGPWTLKTYFSSYCRFQAYGIGLLLGMALYEKKAISHKLESIPFRIRSLIITGTWVSGFISGAISVYGCYFWANGAHMGVWEVAFYNATMRLLWSYFICVIVLNCSLGYGGVINDILGAKFWSPFAKVNYTTYIIHFVLLELFVQTLEQPIRFTTINYTLYASGMLMCINCLALVCSCIIEAPFIQLEKVLLGGK